MRHRATHASYLKLRKKAKMIHFVFEASRDIEKDLEYKQIDDKDKVR